MATDKETTQGDALRALADFADRLPEGAYIYFYASGYPDAASARKLRRLVPGRWQKRASRQSAYTTYTRDFGGGVELTLSVSKGETCERVEVGTEHVAAIPAHDQPVYEWHC
jgi:hypothetical protein